MRVADDMLGNLADIVDGLPLRTLGTLAEPPHKAQLDSLLQLLILGTAETAIDRVRLALIDAGWSEECIQQVFIEASSMAVGLIRWDYSHGEHLWVETREFAQALGFNDGIRKNVIQEAASVLVFLIGIAKVGSPDSPKRTDMDTYAFSERELSPTDSESLTRLCGRLLTIARRDGMLALESLIQERVKHRHLCYFAQYAIDGMSGELLSTLIDTQSSAIEHALESKELTKEQFEQIRIVQFFAIALVKADPPRFFERVVEEARHGSWRMVREQQNGA